MKADEARRLKELELENARLKRRVGRLEGDSVSSPVPPEGIGRGLVRAEPHHHLRRVDVNRPMPALELA